MVETGNEAALIIAQKGPLEGQQWTVVSSLLIGRDTDCDIAITDRQVSRHHARLSHTDKGVMLEDLGSKNGTHKNGETLNKPVILQEGDSFQVALAQNFLFISSDATLPLEQYDSSMQSQPAQYQFQDGQKNKIRFQKLRIDRKSRRVWLQFPRSPKSIDQQELLPPLSVSQYTLLETLYTKRGEVVSRQDLITAIWGEDQAIEVSAQALDALVRRLRDRLTEYDPVHEFIVTVRGHGLRLDNPELSLG